MQGHQPIAIIGMACRFPGAPDSDVFWENLDLGRHSIGEIPPERWSSKHFFSQDFQAKNKTNSKWCGLVDGVERFDRRFFNLSPTEARQMDPQQRLLLEETWHCIEDAGLPVAQLREQRTGVYVGVMARDYHQLSVAPQITPDRFSALGNYDCILANRISHLLGLTGPSMAVDAACASSLVTIHQAKQALRSGECDFALAAGVSLNLHPWKYLSFGKARMLSPSGLCRTFDKDADGYVPGDGVGVLLLQPLEAALAAGNRIHGVLLGSAVNHGGNTRSITAPRVASQQAVIAGALRDAGVGAETISYIEAHGTGTSLGDPIEVEALSRAFRQFTPETGFCKIGSVKSNIGHLEAAAGVAGVIKVLLMMRHRRIPKTLHVKTLNPVIPFENSPFQVALEPSQWHGAPGNALRAGVSSFGFGGVNSHVVLQEPPVRAPKPEIESGCELPLVVTLSARSLSSLKTMHQRWEPFLANKEKHQLTDVLGTAATTRASFEFRSGALVASEQGPEAITKTLQLPENKVPNQRWVLRVGGFGQHQCGLPQWFSKETPLLQASRRLFESLDGGHFGDPEQFLKASWPRPFQKVYGFFCDWLFTSALMDCGLTVRELEVLPGGVYNGLALAGIATPQAIGMAILKGSPKHLPPLKRPEIPFRDPSRNRLIQPFCIGGGYVQQLLAGIDQFSQISNPLVQKTALLYQNQHTFKRYVDAWEPCIGAADRSFQFLLTQSQSGSVSGPDAVLFQVIVGDALRRLNQKWDLSETRPQNRQALDEVLDLLSDGVLTQELVTGLILDPGTDREAAARLLNQRLSRIDRRKPYPLLRESNRHLVEVDDVPRWIGQLEQNQGKNRQKGLTLFPAEASQGDSADGETIEVPELNARAFRATLLQTWLQGASINWNRLFPQGSFKKVALPKYPFEGESLWLGETGLPATSKPEPMAEPEPTVPDLPFCYRPNWVEIPPVTIPSERRNKACVLLSTEEIPVRLGPFQDTYGQVRSITLELPQTVADEHWETAIRGAVKEAFENLPSGLEAVDLFWLPSLSPPKSGTVPERTEWLLRGPFVLAKNLIAAKPDLPVHLVIATSHAFAVEREDMVRGFAAGTLAGFVNALVLERGTLTAAVADLPEVTDIEWLPRCPWRGHGSQVLALRKGRWLGRSFVAWHPPVAPDALKFIHSDVVLITGGLGGLGRLLAKHLVRVSDCQLILIGRSPLDGETSQFLKRLGQKIQYFPVDLTDAYQVNTLLEQIRHRFGSPTGVIHAGGVLEDGLLANKVWATVGRVLGPKVLGTWNLHQATASDPLKVFALFSSVVSVLGNQGQADYAAANAFLDSFADFRTRGGYPGTSLAINWTLWREGGMGLDPSVIAHFEHKSGVITGPEGLCAFQNLIGGPDGQVVVAGRNDLFHEPQAPRNQSQARLKEEKTLDLQKVTQRLLPLLAEIAEVPPAQLDARGDLRDLGLDSIALGQLADRIERCFRVPATAVLLFEMSQIEKLARWIAEETETLGGGLPPRPCSGSSTSPSEVQSKDQGWVGTSGSSSLSPGNVQDREANSDQKRSWKPAPHPNTLDSQVKEGGDIAVIGLSGRYPKASNWREFWQLLESGRDCISQVPENRWDWRRYYDPQQGKPGHMYSKWGGFLEGADQFDARFFNISPAEAETMDPQERLFAEAVWTAMEDSAYTPTSLARNFPLDEGSHVGVFAGVTTNTYLMFGSGENGSSPASQPTSMPWSVANRVSWLFDFRGPSMPVDTACSASLVAVYQACESLRRGECSVAFAGGVNLYLHPAKYLYLCEKRMLSATGKCHSFGALADGFVPGEGVGVVMLKPLETAIRDRDVIHGIIKGGAVNHGGRTHGYTVPNPDAQARLIEDALADGRVDGQSISYVEAHGTGTALGDPIEVRSLKKTLDRASGKCALGSVKTNIGHLESAAGIAGLTKVLLQMKHKRLAPSLNSRETNPKIDLENTPFQIPQEPSEWIGPVRPKNGTQVQEPLRAGISSFGAGGVNAHLIVEEAPRAAPPTSSYQREMVLLSARTEERLVIYARNLAEFLEGPEGAAVSLADLAYTTRVGREPLQERLALVVSQKAELISRLKTFGDSGEVDSGSWRGSSKSGSPVSGALGLLLQGASGDQFLQTVLDQGEWEKLAQLWVQGAVIDWQEAQHRWEGAEPHRVSLPTYPFEPTPHWIARTKTDKTLSPGKEAPTRLPSDLVTCRTEWLAGPNLPDGELFSGVLVVFDYDEVLSDYLKGEIPSRQVVLVKPGSEWCDHGDGVFSLCPDRPGDYEKLIPILKHFGQAPLRVLHLWAASPKWEAFGDDLAMGFGSVFHLCHTLVSGLPNSKAQVLFAHGLGRPEFSALSGFARTLTREPQGLGLRVVGLDTAPHEVAAGLWREFQGSEIEVSLRNGQRHTRRLVPLTLHDVEEKVHPVIRPGAVVLITGGLGGLGFVFAKWLMREFKAKLVLCGRSELNQPLKQRLLQLQDMGGDAVYVPADLGRRDQVAAVVSEARNRFGALHGVIHGAGVIHDATLPNKNYETVKGVLDPKLRGTVWLDEETATDPLDFFVCFSSIAAVAGSAGQADYAFANRFMDDFMARRAKSKRPGRSLSLGWPLWAEGGMKVTDSVAQLMKQTSGIEPLSTAEGLSLFSRALASDEPYVTAASGDVKKLRSYLQMVLEKKEPEPETGALEEEHPLEGIGDLLVASVSRILKIPETEIDLDEDLGDFGFDSVSFTTLASAINEAFGTDLVPAVFYEYPNLRSFEAFLATKRQKKVVVPKIKSARPHAPIPEKAEPPKQSTNIPKLIRQTEPKRDQAIAIIGMAGRMPGSEDLDQFWRHLRSMTDLISEVPADRWQWRHYYGHSNKQPNKTKIKWGGFMPDATCFDAPFFGMSPVEALAMDPQQRLFLETVWQLIETAGYDPNSLSGSKTGLFAGAASSEYAVPLGSMPVVAHQTTGMCHALIANRISWILNLRGPSETLDTACSSSLVAIHHAMAAIRSGECETAIAGGVHLLADPRTLIAFDKGGMLSPRGRCRSFDAGADGYVRGEGVGAVWLKPLEKAETDGDEILAVIRGIAINHGGRTNSLTAPNPKAQAEVVERAYVQADIDPATVGYVEAQAAGTPLGDSAELNGLKAAFDALYQGRQKAKPGQPHCGLGSVKTNIGNLDAAAGMAGLLKVLLAMKHKTLPGTVHFQKQSPQLQLQGSPFYVVDRTGPWKAVRDDSGRLLPRRAGVSAFGFGGVNAHLVLEEYQDIRVPDPVPEETRLILLSARNQDQLKTMARRLREKLLAELDAGGGGTLFLARLARTLRTGRPPLKQRLALLCDSTAQLAQRLKSYLQGDTSQLFLGTVQRSGKSAKNPSLQNPSAADDLPSLAKKWVAGSPVPRGLSEDRLANLVRLNLPAYPFERLRFWSGEAESKPEKSLPKTAKPVSSGLAKSNPNPPVTMGARVQQTLSRESFYLADHQLNERVVLPAAAFLEMVRGALAQKSGKPVGKLEDVTWTKPLQIQETTLESTITFAPDERRKGAWNFTVGSGSHGGVEHARGRAVLREDHINPAFLDGPAIQKRCDRKVSKQFLYQHFRAAGLRYGPCYQTVNRVTTSDTEALGELALPQGLDSGADSYELHPCLLDGALQVASFLANRDAKSGPWLPFSLGSIELFQELGTVGQVYAKRLGTGKGTANRVGVFQIMIADTYGRVLVQLNDFSIRRMKMEIEEGFSRKTVAGGV